MREIYFHEDEYCQLELTPAANWQFCVETMQAAADFSEAHRAEVGWTDLFAIPPRPIRLTELQILRPQLLTAIRDILPPFDRVLYGYSSRTEECKHTLACGPHARLALFAEFEQDVAKAIWLRFDLQTNQDTASALQLCQALAPWPVAIADWGWCRLYQIADEVSLTRYFHERVQVFGKPIG